MKTSAVLAALPTNIEKTVVSIADRGRLGGSGLWVKIAAFGRGNCRQDPGKQNRFHLPKAPAPRRITQLFPALESIVHLTCLKKLQCTAVVDEAFAGVVVRVSKNK